MWRLAPSRPQLGPGRSPAAPSGDLGELSYLSGSGEGSPGRPGGGRGALVGRRGLPGAPLGGEAWQEVEGCKRAVKAAAGQAVFRYVNIGEEGRDGGQDDGGFTPGVENCWEGLPGGVAGRGRRHLKGSVWTENSATAREVGLESGQRR